MLARIGQPNRDGAKQGDRLHALVLHVSLFGQGQVRPDVCKFKARSPLEEKRVSCGENAGADDSTPADQLCEHVCLGRLNGRESFVDDAFIVEAGVAIDD